MCIRDRLIVFTTVEGDLSEGVEVTLRYTDDDSVADSDFTDIDGAVIFTDITPGSYFIEAEIITYSNATLGDALFTFESYGFELGSGEEKTMNITLETFK